MTETWIFWPLIAHVVLIFGLYGLISHRRVGAIRKGSANVAQFRDRSAEPPESITAYNSIVNQFELPVLFYAVCLALFVTDGASSTATVLAWLFVALRYVHAFIHVTSNRIRHRRPVFIAGCLVLAAMWLWFALHLLGLV